MEKYVIRVQGHIDSRYFTWCDGLSVTYTDDGETVLAGDIRDQAELHGLLVQIRDLALPLLSLNRQHIESDCLAKSPTITQKNVL